MDRLLFIFLRRFIRRGSFTVTTAAGLHLHLWRRQRTARRGALHHGKGATRGPARSRAEARRSLYGRHLRRRTRLDCRRACDPAASGAGSPRRIGRCRGWCATCSAACSNSICGRARATTWRIITTSTAGSIRSSSTATSNIAAPISKSPDAVARRRPARQEAPSRGQAARQARRHGARYRLRLGRAGALSRRNCRRAGYRHHAVAGAIPARAKPGARARPHPGYDLPAGRLSRRRGPFRSHRLGRHVRACRRRLLRHLLRQMR